MNPEILSAIRSVLIALGAYAVGKGWLDSAALDTIVGGIVAAVAAWGVYAKRPTSTEARIVAGKVVANPVAEPIPPSKGATL